MKKQTCETCGEKVDAVYKNKAGDPFECWDCFTEQTKTTG